jgi:competence protein ComEA
MGSLRRRLRDSALLTLINLSLCGLLLARLRDPRDTALRVEPAPTRAPQASATPFRMLVHVSGAVLRPGLVRLSEGARVDDAIRAAGGLAPDAAPDRINLAAYVADGLQLHVPAEGDAPGSASLSPPPGAAPSRLATGAGAGPGASVSGSSTASMSGGPGNPATSQVNVNAASASELEQLPGIGPALAARIVAHREAQGPFGSVQDLLEVSGIGQKTLARFETMIVVR